MPAAKPKVHLPCDYCGADVAFYPYRAKRIGNHYCNKQCADAALRFPQRYCADCGIAINRRAQRCRACVLNIYRRPMGGWNKGELTQFRCEVCGAAFERWPSVAKRVGHVPRVCSHECAHELKRRVTGPEHKLWKPKPILTCRNCGEQFETKPSLADKKIFCSRACQGTWQSARQPRVSSIEKLVASELDRRGVEYESQVRLGRFVADFLVGQVIIEVDGAYWHAIPKVAARDVRKDAYYASRGLTVVHVPEASVRAGDFSALPTRTLATRAVRS